MIYIVKHKKYDNPVPDGYKELWVGNKKDKWIEKYNPYINEITGMYRIANDCTEEVVGLVHYRRFFINKGEILTMLDAENILKHYDIILAKRYTYTKGLFESFSDEIREIYRPFAFKYYNEMCCLEMGLRKYFESHYFNPRNMFVARLSIIQEYIKWLMPVIEPILDECIADAKDGCYERIIGYVVERLLTYWVNKNNLLAYEMDYKEI